MLLLILLALALRLPHLGYAEFHEDEAEALMLGVRLLQGEDYALFLHRKGPAQMLLPLAFWLLTGHITETLGRFPFALSSALSVATLFFMGRRWFNWQAGLAAGLLWAISGYSIAFGRMVQYQALIFFLGPLAIYCLYLAHKLAQPRLQIVAALLLAASLLAHFDALLLLPAATYFIWLILRNKGEAGQQKSRGARERGGKGENSSPLPPVPLAPRFRWRLVFTALALILFVMLLASFYVPFALDPQFQSTADYLTETRVKPGFLYNNLDLLRRLDRDYSSHFYLPLLALGWVGFVLWPRFGVPGSGFRVQSSGFGVQSSGSKGAKQKTHYALRNTQHATRNTHYALRTTHYISLLLSITTFWLPDLWQLGSLNLAVIPWLLLLALLFWGSNRPETRAAWLLFGAPFIGYVFLVDDPRTHLYILYPGAALLAGAGLTYFGFWILDLRLAPEFVIRHASRSFVIRALAGVVIVWVALIVTYEAAIFLPTESIFTRLREQWDGSLWETAYNDIPTAREYFGYPKREGWKAIGALRAQGHFPGDFRSIDEDFIIPVWYNYGQARSCYNTPVHYFARATAGETVPLPEEQYTEVGRVRREGETRLRIFEANGGGQASPTLYQLEQLAPIFDQRATPRQFARQAEPARRIETQFGAEIQFVGYTLPTATVRPGGTLRLNLYWLALRSPQEHYRAFVHLTDGATLFAQQDDDPACRLPTTIWRAGQRGVGQFRLPVDANTPPGRYPLIIGLYRADTLERLKITGGAGQTGDDFLWLQDIEVVE